MKKDINALCRIFEKVRDNSDGRNAFYPTSKTFFELEALIEKARKEKVKR